MVRVPRFELWASWTPFKRDTKLRHTRKAIYVAHLQLLYISTGFSICQLIIIVFYFHSEIKTRLLPVRYHWSKCRDPLPICLCQIARCWRALPAKQVSGGHLDLMVRILLLKKGKSRNSIYCFCFLVRVSRFELEASWTPFLWII